MRDLHLNDLIDFVDLLVGKELFHHQSLVSITVPVSVQVLELESFLGRTASLHNQDSPGPLPHPLVLDSSNLGVGVPHHGDQQVEQEDGDDHDEDEPEDPPDDAVVGVAQGAPDVHNLAQGHHEGLQETLHGVRHGVVKLR